MEPVLQKAVAALQNGGVVVYPTDTVYGFGADATQQRAIQKIALLKGRDVAAKPFLVMVQNMEMLAEYAVVTPVAQRLADAFLPGPLTLILEQKGTALDYISAQGGQGVGFRIPNNEICMQLVRGVGKPIVSTSVNESGMPPIVSMTEIQRRFPRVDAYVDAGELPASVPSTIVDARGDTARIVRDGALAVDASMFL